MPDWVKDGYQNSITGLTERVSKGQAIKEYDLNIMEDVGATLIYICMENGNTNINIYYKK